MSMLRQLSTKIIIITALLLAVSFGAAAQAYTGYSPYSIFGVGDLNRQSTAYSNTMGGVGIANRTNRYLNAINPASITERDSLSFMADFSLHSNNKVFNQGNLKSANNTFNVNDFIISFPLQRQSAMMLGILPYSDMGFDYSYREKDPGIVGNVGNIEHVTSGQGGMYKVFVAAGVTFFKRLSLGAQFDYYFGKIDKSYSTSFSDDSYSSIKNNTVLNAHGVGGKFGLQYEQPLGSDIKLTLGATYTTDVNMKGFYTDGSYSVSSAASDTLYYRVDTLGLTKNVKLASEYGVGISIKKANKWMFEMDYTRSDWTQSGIEAISGYSAASTPFKTSISQAYRIGFEYIPNINDVRYLVNRIAYRAGAYHKTEYYLLYGQEVASTGITFGISLPINRMYNALSIGFDFGQRGVLKDDFVRERYFNFTVGMNIFDIWFRKNQYD